jgi:hypothetical protein
MALSERDHEIIKPARVAHTMGGEHYDATPELRMCDLTLLANIAASRDWIEVTTRTAPEMWGMLARLSANELVEVSVDRVLTVKARITSKAQEFVAGLLDATPGDPANGLVIA